MYPKYFGLKEPSFSIAPDPHYLFLSRQHREALAHLLYGAAESGGFVLLTGEVGTGKTTVCRAFLEQLPEGVEVALVFNPVQSANELLTNICEEFRIPLPPGKRSSKLLIDRLNDYLLDAHANGRRPLLIIDEAQNLLPQAMEQIRLLTNLETTKHKLLQIFLIGQPELRRMLETERLRQLNQRITARFHLTPLTLQETGDYIRHRIAVAGVDRPLFSTRAIRLIHRYSAGVPRVINILCDRALLGTCVTRGSQVTPRIVAKAAREVRGDPVEVASRSAIKAPLLALVAFCLATGVGFLAHSRLGLDPREWLSRWFQQEERAPLAVGTTGGDALPDAHREPPSPPLAAETPPVPGEEPATEVDLVEDAAVGLIEPSAALAGPEPAVESLAMAEPEAMRVLLRRWGLDLKTIAAGDPCQHIRPFGLGCELEQGQLSHVRFFDLPALLRVSGRDGGARYIVLGALDVARARLDLPSGSAWVALDSLESAWKGDYTLVWQLPPSGSRLIRAGSRGEDVRWLRDLLSSVPEVGLAPSESTRFDADLAVALRAFQASRGLAPDGVAGPRTLIALYQAVGLPGVPRLVDEAASLPPEEVGP